MENSIITNNEITEWELISSKIREFTCNLREEKTDPAVVKEREGAHGAIWSYIGRITAMRWLDTNYPGWSFEVLPESFKETAGYMTLACRMTIYSSGLKRILTVYGTDEIKSKKDNTGPVIKDYLKTLETDALKRACFTLGGFTDVYTGEDINETIITDEDLEWFERSVLPVLIDRYRTSNGKIKTIFGPIKMFTTGKWTKEEVCNKLNIEV